MKHEANGHTIMKAYQIKSNQIKSNQITFIVTSPQHKCLGEWNSYERAPDSAEKQQQFTYGQTVQKTALEHLQCSRQCKKNNNSNLHMDRQCKKKQQQFTYGQYIFTDDAHVIFMWFGLFFIRIKNVYMRNTKQV